MTSKATWPIPLNHKPEVLQISKAYHGQFPKQNFLVKGLWCVHLYCYRGMLLIEGKPFPIRPGFAGIIPPDLKLEYHFYGPSHHVYAHFRLPQGASGTFPIPVMQDLQDRFEPLYQRFENAVGCYSTYPRKTEVEIWSILWDLLEQPRIGTSSDAAIHPAVSRALTLIETRLSESLSGEWMAREVHLSQNHLIRLFQEVTGTSLHAYVRKKRAEKARHLLLYSTLPIKTIASEVGIPDPHLFNKTIRQLFGMSPRKLRQTHISPAFRKGRK